MELLNVADAEGDIKDISNIDVLANLGNAKTRLALVLGEDTRSFLSVIRSLGRAGFDVHVVCYDRNSPSISSKYVSEVYYYNYQSHRDDEWLTHVLCLIERYPYDLVFPCDERAIYPLWKVRNQIPPTTKLAIANQEALEILFDKWKTKQVALGCNVPVAEGELVNIHELDYRYLETKYGEKFVVKPLHSFEMSSLEKRNKVAIVTSEADLLEFIESNSQQDMYLVETYFQGYGEGVSVLAWKGEVKAVFSYRRLAEPDSGGGSSYRGSTKLDPNQLLATEKICKETNLSGLAMFEFRRNEETKRWILVEVNARVWGGLPLAEYAKVDFPKIYADFLLNNPKQDNGLITSNMSVSARALTADLYEIRRESEKLARNSGRIATIFHVLNRLAGVAKCITSKESIDSLRLDDPSPFFEEVKRILANIPAPISRYIPVITHYRRWLAQKRFKDLLQINSNRAVIFICYGNIIRSPFAQAYFHFLLNKERSKISVIDSFGFHIKEQRLSPDIALQAASKWQCDLANHRSKRLTQFAINESDLIVFFDKKNLNMLNSFYRVNHAFCAADFLDNQFPLLSEIEDPYESNVETISHCYAKIVNALDNMRAIHREATYL